MTLEVMVMTACGALISALAGFLISLLKKHIDVVSENTMQVALLNQKMQFLVEEIETIRVDVDDLKLWRAGFKLNELA